MSGSVIDFITKYYMQHILYLLELLACITGFIYWEKIKDSFWKWFPFYLFIIVAVEITGDYLNYVKDYDLKNRIYNTFSIPLEFLFLYWIFYRYAEGRKRKQLVIACLVIYLVSIMLDQLLFRNTNYFFDSFSYSIGNLVLLVTVISFFIQFSNSNEILHFKTSMIFWVALGILIFYLGSLPFYGLYNLLYKKYPDVFLMYSYVMFICNWIMYSLFIVAFIWGKPR